MATYAELYDLLTRESEVKGKVKVAVLVAAKAVYDEDQATPNHANRLAWARQVLVNPGGMADQAFPVLLATYRNQGVDEIKAASDADIQKAVDDHVNLFAGG